MFESTMETPPALPKAEDASMYALRSPRSSRSVAAEQDPLGAKRKRDEQESAANSAVQWSTPVNPFPKTGPRKKAVARPEDPGGVEDICYAEILLSVPTELFKLEGLQSILNLTTWDECLSEKEKEFLLQFLPDVDDPRELLSSLLDGQTNFSFGNPLQQIWELMKQGECHPRVAKYREALRCLQHCQHFHIVRDYHNNMVMQLRQMAQDDVDVPLHQRLAKWNAKFKDRTPHLGRDVRRQRRKNISEKKE